MKPGFKKSSEDTPSAWDRIERMRLVVDQAPQETICLHCGRLVSGGLLPTVFVNECDNCARPTAA